MFWLKAELKDKSEIMNLYRQAIGSEGCTWNMDYPNEEIYISDIKRNDLFCLKNEQSEIVGAISIEDDELVENLECWSKDLGKAAEIARVVIKEEYRNQGIAKILLENIEVELKKRGFKVIRLLVSKNNRRAIKLYLKFNFKNVGESDLYDSDWWCCEKIIG